MIDVLFVTLTDMMFGVLCVSILMGYAGSICLLLWGTIRLWLCVWINLRIYTRLAQVGAVRLQRLGQSKLADHIYRNINQPPSTR